MNASKLLDCTIPVGAVLGAVITAQDIYTWLGILLLVFQILLIVAKGVQKIRDSLKHNDMEELEKALDETTKELEEIKNKENK